MENITPKTIYQLGMSDTVYEASDDTFPDTAESPTQHYIDESIRKFAEIARDENRAFKKYLSQFPELPRMYMIENIQESESYFDHGYGVAHELELEKFSVGGSVINFDGPDLIVNDILYKGSPGLYELLFKKNPLVVLKQMKRNIWMLWK